MVGGSWGEVGGAREIEAVKLVTIAGKGSSMHYYLFLYFVYYMRLH